MTMRRDRTTWFAILRELRRRRDEQPRPADPVLVNAAQRLGTHLMCGAHTIWFPPEQARYLIAAAAVAEADAFVRALAVPR